MDSETDATQTVVGSIESAAPRAKRQRKEADKRRARVQDLHNKYADIDFTRYQDTHADQYPPTLSMAEDASAAQGNSGAACGRIVPVKPALVDGRERHLFPRSCLALAFVRWPEVVLGHLLRPVYAPERLHAQASLHFPNARR